MKPIANWSTADNVVLLNPRMPVTEKQEILQALETIDVQGHIWLTTSGSSGQVKLVALAKNAILSSAAAVNAHLQSNQEDIWMNVLPHFHVGGLAIFARCYLSGAKCVIDEGKWDPKRFVEKIQVSKATLTSLVPAQVFDLVQQQWAAPTTIRAVIVGGGTLTPSLYFAALKLGWKLLPSYGMTECASQIATAPVDCWTKSEFPSLTPLQHISLRKNNEGYLQIKSPALFTAYIYKTEVGYKWVDPKFDGWFTTEDRADILDGMISNISRGENFVKIGGESVDILRLERILDEVLLSLAFSHNITLLALPDKRLGHAIHLAAACDSCAHDDLNKIIDEFQKRVLPFERIRYVHFVKNIPRSPLKKVLKAELVRGLVE